MFYYSGDNHYLKDCVELANELVENEKFLDTVSECTFDMATCDGEYISQAIEAFGYSNRVVRLTVKTYYPKWKYSKALGYFSPSTPDTIYLNINKLNRSKGSIVASLIHEMIHYLDHLDTEHGFGHGSNNSNGKQNTAPYFIDNLAEEFIDGTIDYNNTDNSKIYVYTPWWIRLWNYAF